MSRTILSAVLGLSLLSSVTTFASGIDPQKAAQIQADRDKAMADVKKKYGDKKASELSNDERRQMAKDQADAEKKALAKNGVNPKEWSRYEATQSKSDRAATEQAKEELRKKDEAAAAKGKDAKQDGPKEIEIQRGFGNEGPDGNAAANAKKGKKK